MEDSISNDFKFGDVLSSISSSFGNVHDSEMDLGGGRGDEVGDSSVEDELEDDNEAFVYTCGSPWGKGSPGRDALSNEIPSPSCNNVTEETEENVDKFCEWFVLIISS